MNAALNNSFLLFCITITLTACGGGGNGGEGSSNGNSFVNFTIGQPSNSSSSTTSSRIEFSGDSECPNCPAPSWQSLSCPSLTCPEESGITIKWKNMDTGESGVGVSWVSRPICECLFTQCTTYCVDGWFANVPLKFGPNSITITASKNPDKEGSQQSRTVSRILRAPEDLVAVTNGNEITLTWKELLGADSYNLYWSQAEVENVINLTETSYAFNQLEVDKKYDFQVQAVKNEVGGVISEPVSALVNWDLDIVTKYPLSEFAKLQIAMKLDSNNNPTILFGDSSFDAPKLAYVENGVWETTTINNLGRNLSGEAVSLVIDNNDDIRFIGREGYDSFYTDRSTSFIEIFNNVSICKALAWVDKNNNPQVLYSSYPTYDQLSYSSSEAGNWTTEIIPITGFHGCVLDIDIFDMVMDSEGDVHFIVLEPVTNTISKNLLYFTNKNGFWEMELIDTNVQAEGVSLDVHNDNSLHATYAYQSGELVYAHNRFGVWIIETVDNISRAKYPSIAIDKLGNVHLSYMLAVGELQYSTKSNGAWKHVLLDDPVLYEKYSDTKILVDKNNNIHIGHYNKGMLKYAHRKF